MPDEPQRRIVIEKSSTVRRRYQRSNKQFRFTAAELKRIEREEELDRRAKTIREKEKRRIANKKKKDEQEQERKRLGLPDPNARKVPSSQPLLSNFLGLSRKPAVALEPQPIQNRPNSNLDSASEDTEVDSDGPDDLDEELEDELSCLQEAMIPQELGENDAAVDKELEPNLCCPQGSEVTISEEVGEYGTWDEELENELLCPQEAVVSEQVNAHNTTPETNDADDDTDPFDDLDEELERELYGLQDAGTLEGDTPNDTTNGVSNGILALASDRDDDEFSDCSAFDDQDMIQAAKAAGMSPSIQLGAKDQPPSKTPVILHAPSNVPSNACPPPIVAPAPSNSDSFRDDTADYLEEVFARGCGDSFGEIF